jgi:hypothetical protein
MSKRLLALVLLALPLGCARKAPGPMECHELALRVAGLPVPLAPQQRIDPRIQRALEEVTLRCLTTPYDRELLACVRSGLETRGCFAAFQQRHPERVQRTLPRPAP